MNLVTVDFNNHQLEVIEETQSIVVKDICEAIGIGYISQYEKIVADESYESKLIKVQTKGGLQEVFTIPLSKLNGWLFSINPNKVKPEVKQKLIEYKKECFNVLNNYFNNGIAVNHRVSETIIHQELSKLNQEIKDLKNQLKVKEEVNPFRGYYTSNWTFRLRENEYAYTRKDWMLLLNECERTLVYERQNRSYSRQLSYKGGI